MESGGFVAQDGARSRSRSADTLLARRRTAVFASVYASRAPSNAAAAHQSGRGIDLPPTWFVKPRLECVSWLAVNA